MGVVEIRYHVPQIPPHIPPSPDVHLVRNRALKLMKLGK